MSFYSPYNQQNIYQNYTTVVPGGFVQHVPKENFYGHQILRAEQFRSKVLRADHYDSQFIPRVPQQHYLQVNQNTHTPHGMHTGRAEQYNNYTKDTTGKDNVPNLESVLHNQVHDYMTMSLERQVTDVSANKENTKILKNWLKTHRNNPYPSKTEKVMMAYSTRMTLTQISNWFANARRRIKQEKMAKKILCELSNPTMEATSSEQIENSESSYLGNISFVSECSTRSETPSELGGDSSMCNISELHRSTLTPDSGLESFNSSDSSLEKFENTEEDNKKLKCKMNLFGEDSTPEIHIIPIDIPGTIQTTENHQSSTAPWSTDRGQNTKTEVKNSKIWSITDILNSK